MADAYVHSLLRIAVSQICLEADFVSGRRSAIDCLTDVTRKYIEEIGANAAATAALARRSEVNYHDMIVAMGDMNVTVGDLHEWHTISDQIPFAKRQSPAIPRFPLTKPVLLVEPDSAEDINGASANNNGSLPTDVPPSSDSNDDKKATTAPSSTSGAAVRIKKTSTHPHIPPFLPDFPDRRTYIHTPVFSEPDTDRNAVRKRKVEQIRQVEQSLSKLHRAAASAITPSLTNGASSSSSSEEKVTAPIPRHYQASEVVGSLRSPYWGTVSTSDASTTEGLVLEAKRQQRDLLSHRSVDTTGTIITPNPYAASSSSSSSSTTGSTASLSSTNNTNRTIGDNAPSDSGITNNGIGPGGTTT